MNYGEIQTRVLRRLAATSDDPIADDVDDYVNEALHYLETMAPDGWPWMRQTITITTTVAPYTFTQLASFTTASASVAKVLSIRQLNDTYWQQLDYRTVDEAQQLYPNRDRTGPSETYSVDGNTVTLYPTPDSGRATEFRVVTVEPDLSATGSSPVLPSVFHGAIVDAACLVAYQVLQDDKRMELYEQKVNRWVDRFRRYGNQAEGSPRIKVREWL